MDLIKKINQEVRIIISVFLAGAGLVLWMNANVGDPIKQIQTEQRLFAQELGYHRIEIDGIKVQNGSQDHKLADYVARIIRLERN